MDTSKVARELFDSLVTEDAKGFNGILNRAEISLPLGKCFWIRVIIERIVVTPLGFVEECWLREDLTAAERLLYLRFAIRHRQLDRISKSKQISFEEKTRRNIIPIGTFFDELRTNGLVVCTLSMTYDTSPLAVPEAALAGLLLVL